jgi:hypothetical protein
MSLEDQPTQQIRRDPPAAPMPGSMNPAGPPTEAAAPVENPNDGTTDVLSIDDLFDAPPKTRSPEVTAAPPTSTPAAPVGDQRRIGVVPAASNDRPRGFTDRLRGDGVAAWQGGLTRSREWLAVGDNAVIVATAFVAMLLLLAVGLF